MCARLGANARQSVIAHYSIDCVIEQYLSLYNLPKIEIRAAVLFGGEN
jgi:hypothetical protein